MHSVKDLLQKKRDGQPLSPADIVAFVAGISDGSVTDAQIAAFTMAIWFRGMSVEEEMNLTLAMRDSGEVLRWRDLGGPVVDKHSTGGVGDLVSLILGPLVASCGAYVPMISGRGLGHTGGTLDKLESIPGFHCSPGIEGFQRLVRDQGIAIIGQTEQLAPADRRIYAIRDVTATVASQPLIISSILSKKLAEGLNALVMDIKFGSGAFMPGPEEAAKLAGEITRVSCQAGLPCNALVTDMDQPLAWSAGNALEVLEAIAFLKGDARHERLEEAVLSLSAELLSLAGIAKGVEEGRRLAVAAVESGRAAERFERMVSGQGGPADILDNTAGHFAEADYVRPVFHQECGYVERMDMRAVGSIVVALGGGRKRSEDGIDPRVGLSAIRRVGEAVGADSPVAVVHAANEADWQAAAFALRSAISVGAEPVGNRPVVDRKIEGIQP
jgi:thymidine phosphorylase